jgi:hypothetical protein
VSDESKRNVVSLAEYLAQQKWPADSSQHARISEHVRKLHEEALGWIASEGGFDASRVPKLAALVGETVARMVADAPMYHMNREFHPADADLFAAELRELVTDVTQTTMTRCAEEFVRVVPYLCLPIDVK